MANWPIFNCSGKAGDTRGYYLILGYRIGCGGDGIAPSCTQTFSCLKDRGELHVERDFLPFITNGYGERNASRLSCLSRQIDLKETKKATKEIFHFTAISIPLENLDEIVRIAIQLSSF